MNLSLFKLSGLGIALGLFVIAPTALAQTRGADDLLENNSEPNSGEVFSGSGVDFGDLVHRASQAGGITQAEFRQRQARDFEEATSDFLQRRQEALQQTAPAEASADESLEVGL
ncbi:MAG: hypothetical protein F6J97_06565 [Leptolyngbya sp. SIO4C1]|nr:hypothetical protein [Leptolyngbya sp. SIO4C1]